VILFSLYLVTDKALVEDILIFSKPLVRFVSSMFDFIFSGLNFSKLISFTLVFTSVVILLNLHLVADKALVENILTFSKPAFKFVSSIFNFIFSGLNFSKLISFTLAFTSVAILLSLCTIADKTIIQNIIN